MKTESQVKLLKVHGQTAWVKRSLVKIWMHHIIGIKSQNTPVLQEDILFHASEPMAPSVSTTLVTYFFKVKGQMKKSRPFDQSPIGPQLLCQSASDSIKKCRRR